MIRVKIPDGREGFAVEWNRYSEIGPDKKERMSALCVNVRCDDGSAVELDASLVERLLETKDA